MLKIEALKTFLELQGVVGPWAFNRPKVAPDRLITITDAAGTGLQMQDLFENVGVLFNVRSPKDAPLVARDLSHQIDRVMLDHNLRPFFLDGRYVIATGRMGGGPAYTDTDDQNRTIYACSYWLELAR